MELSLFEVQLYLALLVVMRKWLIGLQVRFCGLNLQYWTIFKVSGMIIVT